MWNSITASSSAYLGVAWGGDTRIVLAVGYQAPQGANAAISRSIDGGYTWSTTLYPSSSSPVNKYTDVGYYNASGGGGSLGGGSVGKGYFLVVSNLGEVLLSSDYGLTWSDVLLLGTSVNAIGEGLSDESERLSDDSWG